MIFSKEFLSKKLEEFEMNESYRLYRHERLNKNPKDKVPFDLVISNKIRYFDQKSSDLKNILFKSRKAIAEKCYTNDLNSTFPNQGKIDQCIRQNEEEYKKLDYLRETHFSNLFHRYKLDLEECPTHNTDCVLQAQQSLVWNSAKLPYFYAENY